MYNKIAAVNQPVPNVTFSKFPDNKVHEAYMGPTWGGQVPSGSHAGPMYLNIMVNIEMCRADIPLSSLRSV